MSASGARARINARGDVWCHHCRRYRHPDEFKRHPSQDRWWSYCKSCTRALDRMRERNIRGTEAWRRDQERRLRHKRRQQRREQAERRRFVQEAIVILRRRGLTKSEISRIARVSLGNLLKWERGEQRCDPNVARRLGELLLLTADWPLADEPAFRRRLPHPEAPRLMQAMERVVASYPVRTRWTPREDG